jgi:hypothetical protein
MDWSKVMEKSTQKLLVRSLQAIFLMTLSSVAVSAESLSKHDAVSHTVRYLDPSIWSIIVNDNDCFVASPRSLLQVEPMSFNNGNRVYKVSQFFDAAISRELYAQPITEQIKNQKIIGREFCGGIVSMSNMDVPFVKGTSFKDANDGELLVDKIERELSSINGHLNKMSSLAEQATSGVYSSSQLSDLNVTFQALIAQIDHISRVAKFNDLPILNGSRNSVDIPVSQSSSIINIPLLNATSENLTINRLNISSQSAAQDALMFLKSITALSKEFSSLSAARAQLDEAVREDGDMVMVDVRTDDFAVQHQKASVAALSSKIHS